MDNKGCYLRKYLRAVVLISKMYKGWSRALICFALTL